MVDRIERCDSKRRKRESDSARPKDVLAFFPECVCVCVFRFWTSFDNFYEMVLYLRENTIVLEICNLDLAQGTCIESTNVLVMASSIVRLCFLA